MGPCLADGALLYVGSSLRHNRSVYAGTTDHTMIWWRNNMEVKIIRSRRKTVGIQVNEDLTVTVRAPLRVSKKEIDRILKEKESWILKSIERMKERAEKVREADFTRLTESEVRLLADEALKVIPERVAYFSKLAGVTYGRITIRNQKTRWGSCSSKGNLNFNCLLMLTPPEVIDYVVVHELCHRKEMNHSKQFWSEVEKILPDYKKQEKWLKNEGSLLMKRMS